MIWGLLLSLTLLSAAAALTGWRRGLTIQELVRRPPEEVNLPEFVTILNYLHHELIKHRLPLVRTVAGRDLEQVQPADVDMLKLAVTGRAERPSVTRELEGYLAGLQRAAGSVHLNFWRDPLVRRVRRACLTIQQVADGLGDRHHLTPDEHRRLRRADHELDTWFRPRLQALRNSVLVLPLTLELIQEQARRASAELGVEAATVDLPELPEPLQLKMLRSDFELVLRNLIRNGLRAAAEAGSPRVAIEVATRLELTGEETVLLRIYDTEPTILSRDQLYGRELGRGLNLITTTLRRYDGAIACRKSRRDGYAKFMEVRLRRALAESDNAELLQTPDPAAFLVPGAVGLAAAALAGVATAGLLGLLPDPFDAPPENVAALDAGLPDADAVAVNPEAATTASNAAADLGRRLRSSAERRASAAHPDLRNLLVPAPTDIGVDPRRCLEPTRYNAERRLVVECRLVSSASFLEAPVLTFRVPNTFDLSRLKIDVEEQVESGDGIVAAADSCMTVAAVPAGERVPLPFRSFLSPEEREPDTRPRLMVEYLPCLERLRYPLRLHVTLDRPDAPEDRPDLPGARKIDIDLTIRLRPEEARDVYPRIANSDLFIKDRATRAALTRTIARTVARKLEYSFTAGVMPEPSQLDFAAALYFGWIRPGIHDAIIERIRSQRARKTPAPEFCAHAEDITGGLARMQELSPRIVHADLYRSEYYAHQSRLWIGGDLPGAVEALQTFLRTRGDTTDFAQGARFYLALLLTLGDPPRTEGGVGGAILKTPNPDDPGQRTARLLLDMLRDARKPPLRGSDYDWDAVKLLGVHQLLDEDIADSLGSGVSVDDALCGFYEARSRWIESMNAADARRLFGHCPRFVLPLSGDSLLRPAAEPDAGAPPPEDRPLPVLTEPVRRTLEYIQRGQELWAQPWGCDPKPLNR